MAALVSAIRPIWNEMPLSQDKSANEVGQGASFTDIFTSAIDDVRQTDQEAVQLEYLMSTGQLDNPAEVGIALYKASTAVNLLVNLRNQAVEAYNEIMRISL